MNEVSYKMLALLEKQRLERLELIGKVSHKLFIELCNDHTKEIEKLVSEI